jgi:hypothetical protein
VQAYDGGGGDVCGDVCLLQMLESSINMLVDSLTPWISRLQVAIAEVTADFGPSFGSFRSIVFAHGS